MSVSDSGYVIFRLSVSFEKEFSGGRSPGIIGWYDQGSTIEELGVFSSPKWWISSSFFSSSLFYYSMI